MQVEVVNQQGETYLEIKTHAIRCANAGDLIQLQERLQQEQPLLRFNMSRFKATIRVEIPPRVVAAIGETVSDLTRMIKDFFMRAGAIIPMPA